jgi:hypothetical protein
MRLRSQAVVTFAALALTAGHAAPVRAHAGDNDAAHVHACVGSFGGIRIVGVSGMCAPTETALHWNPADRPTTFAAQQTLDAIATGTGEILVPGLSVTFTLTNPATLDVFADGSARVIPFAITNGECAFMILVDGVERAGREVAVFPSPIGTFHSSWSAQLNGFPLAAGTHTVALWVEGFFSGGCHQPHSPRTDAQLRIVLR